MSIYYAEIDENGKCYHITQNELPLSDRILKVEEDVFGKIWDGENWNEEEIIETESTAPTEAQLTQAKLDYLMMMAEG